MGIVKGIAHVFQDVTSLGGTFRIRADRDRYHRLVKVNDNLCERLYRYDAELTQTKIEIAKQVDVIRGHLKIANRILRYAPGVGFTAVLSPAVAESAHVPGLDELPIAPKPATSMKTTPPTIAGIGAGAFTSAGTYGTAEVLANSTAMAAGTGVKSVVAKLGIAGMSGGTATTGTFLGAMVAASPLLLTGVGTAAFVTVATAVSHSRANELSRTCRKLKDSQKDRNGQLRKLVGEVKTLELLEFKLKNEDRVLAKSIDSAQQSLFPFGPFSHVWRVMKKPFTGSYYQPREVPIVEGLNEEVQQFVATFKKRTAVVPATASVPV